MIRLDPASLALWRGRPAGGALVLGLTALPLPAQLAFARPSPGAAFGAGGLLAQHPADAPRIAHDPLTGAARGLLVEPEATNLVARSDELADPYWSASNLTVTAGGGGQGPDGTALDRLTSAGSGAAIQRSIPGVTLGAPHAVSAFLRRDGHRYAGFWGFGNHNSGVGFDLVSGAAQINGNWLAAGTEPVSAAIIRIWAVLEPSGSTVVNLGFMTGTGGGKAVGAGAVLDAGGFQVEPGSAPTSPIATTGTAATRAADAPGLTGIAGSYDVTVTPAEGAPLVLAGQSVGEGWWPALPPGMDVIAGLRLDPV